MRKCLVILSLVVGSACGLRASADEPLKETTEFGITITPDGKLHIPDGVQLPSGPTTFDEAKHLYEEGRRGWTATHCRDKHVGPSRPHWE